MQLSRLAWHFLVTPLIDPWMQSMQVAEIHLLQNLSFPTVSIICDVWPSTDFVEIIIWLLK
jgi:hypothetical protein